MKNGLNYLKLILLCMISFPAFAQSGIETDILEKGYFLYELEKASWYSTDLLFEEHKELVDSIGSYLSYKPDDDKVITVFFLKENPDMIRLTIQFDGLPDATPDKVTATLRNASAHEKDLFELVDDAKRRVTENEDDLFTLYENTGFNFIPVIQDGKRSVYILSGSKQNGTLYIGNDYLLTYNNRNKFKQAEKIHNSLIPFQFVGNSEAKKIQETSHSHVNSEYIDPTDICTLLLYKDFIEWDQHYVISDKHVSIFDIKNEHLLIITRKAWERIGKK
ncbi:hypothetical protein [Robertkochia solimangrovi]|uniref:hypothetical protein n=1 Tax=Robertkochia solimangrovi TaxID=2213046 RepID=UPI001181659F|nr:hypothetical protein [Robertkochia solimangrovi]TRZ43200.1 hypothetical protein DMZ48_10940 [Robertkochia solimangrovi]